MTGRKIWASAFCLILLCVSFLLYGCASAESASSGDGDEKLKIVCTIFPEYDWVREILGERAEDAELVLLLKNGSDLHSYQPTVWDMMQISDADLFLYVGGESDAWVEDALANVKNPQQRTLNLMEILEEYVREEKVPEGAHGHDHEDEEETEYDEHVWLSLRNAKVVCAAIRDMLMELDEDHAVVYEENADVYLEKLNALDETYTEVTEQAAQPVLLFGDRFPFRYLAEDYALTYYAAFSGCSAETEASFSTIAYLADKVEELGLPVVFQLDGSDGRIAATIAENAGTQAAQVLTLDSMQSVSQADIEAGETYLSIMERNLEALRTALPLN